MGYLLHILLAVVAQAAGEADLAFAAAAPWWGAALLAVPHVLAARARSATLAGRFAAAGRRHRLLWLSPPLCFALFVLGTDWVGRVRAWTGAELRLTSWPEPALMLAFLPYVVLQLVGIDAEARVHEPRPRERRRLVAFQCRLFASSLLPLFFYVAVATAAGWRPEWRAHVEQVGLFHAAFVGLLLGALALALPAILAWTWDTVPLPAGPQRALLEAVGQRAGFRAHDVRVWRTGDTMANAAIVGVGRRRIVLLSDSLLSMLSLRELAAVYAHEIGHAKRHHVWVFLAWAVAFFLAGDLLASWLAPGDEWVGTGVLGATLGAWAVGFGWLSRRCELEADLYSLEVLGEADSIVSALQRVGGRLRDVAGWRHFSTNDRVRFIARAAADPRVARAHRTRLRWIARLGAALCLAVLALQLAGLFEDLPEDRFRADLSLGRYELAVARAERAPDFDEELLSLGALGRDVVGAAGRGEPEQALEDELARALAAGELERAAGCALLLVLRGRDELTPVVDVLAAVTEEDGDPAGARATLAEAPPPWRARLAPWVERAAARQ